MTAPRPAQLPPGCFSPGVVALMALMHGRFWLSHREVVAYLQMVWRLPIRLGSVTTLPQVASSALAPALEDVQTAIEPAEHLNVDETRWREGKRKPWWWVAVRSCPTLFLLQYGRGKKQLRQLVGEAFVGLVTSDRLCASNRLERKRRQRWWAHLVRNLRARAEAEGPWQEAAAARLAQAEEVLKIWAQDRAGEIEQGLMKAQLTAMPAAMGPKLEPATQQTNYLGSRCVEMLKHWEALWTCIEHAGVEPTSNAAERALRPAGLWRTGWYGTQSASGSRFVERMLTVSATCQQQERPLWPFLVEAITASWAGQPAPRLWPSNLTP